MTRLRADSWFVIPRADSIGEGRWSGYVYAKKGTAEYAAAGFVMLEGSNAVVQGTIYGMAGADLRDAASGIMGFVSASLGVQVEEREAEDMFSREP